MGKTYLRIANRNPASARGYFPRRLLRVIGASSKRGSDGEDQIGQFGTGKKLAPPAALRMNMEVFITSHDAEGPYFYGYRVLPQEGHDDLRVVMVAHGGEDVVLDIDPGAAKNWDEPIGDDPVRSIHVLREYLQDAKDADPNGPHLQIDCTVLAPAIAGTTSVYVSMTDEVRHVLAHPKRYFKFLANEKPFFAVDGLGCLYAKSESGVTRLFASSKGSLAFCSKRDADASVFDYGFFEKDLLSEERTFRSLSQVHARLMRLLVNLSDHRIARALLAAMLEGKARLELAALAHLGAHGTVPQAQVWKQAWDELYPGKDAVISSFYHYYDEYARSACGKHVVTVSNDALRNLLRLSGVSFAVSLYPDHKKNAEIVVPKPEQARNLEKALRMLGRWGFVHPEYETKVYRPYIPAKDGNDDLGFCVFDGDAKGTYVLERMTDDVRDAVETGYHEHAHARSGAIDGSREFDDRKDNDVGRMVLVAERLVEMLAALGVSEEEIAAAVEDLVREDEEDDGPDIDVVDDDADPFDDEPTRPRMSPLTEKALELIRKMRGDPSSDA